LKVLIPSIVFGANSDKPRTQLSDPRHKKMAADSDLNQIWQWNSTDFPTIKRCMHDVVMDFAQSQPHATAVHAWDGEMTYGSLDCLSTLIARHLVELGIQGNPIIPLCFEKSMWVVPALFGVFKAGGAALLIDPSLPESRIQLMLAQVKAPLILSSHEQELLCSRWFKNPVVVGSHTRILEFPFDDQASSCFPPLPTVSPSDLLYVVFTSGSTGIPKGCLIEHQHISSAVAHQKTILSMDSTSRVYDFASHSFDAVYWSLFQALSSGAVLCIPSEGERKNQLTESIRRFSSTDLFLTTSTARIVDVSRVPTVRNIYLGGEVVTSDDQARWIPYANTINLYGPSEATPATAYVQIQSSMPRKPLVGKSVGVSSWVVDPESSGDRLAPIGTVGELFLEGPLVGRGYLEDEERTAASFIRDPAWLRAGSPDGTVPGRSGRLYKTGDLVQYDPADGTLFFIGRKDAQVKLRGQRIELPEVEYRIKQSLAIMTEFPAVSNAEVVAEVIVPKAMPHPMLVGFVCGCQSKVDDLQQALDATLRSQLPTYMVPSTFIPVPALPLTTSGKLDRKRLREIGESLPREQLIGLPASDCDCRPRTTSERFVQALWATVLDLPDDQISTDSNFLRLGGDSVTAMRLSALAHQQGAVLTVAHILSAPNLSAMATEVVNADPGLGIQVDDSEVIPFSLLKKSKDHDAIFRDISRQCAVDVSQIQDVFPCTIVQRSLLSLTAMRANSYVARFKLPLRKDVDIFRLMQAWEEASRTVAKILCYRIVDVPVEGLVQVQLNEALQWERSENLEIYLEKDRKKPMGLSTPLTRLAIVEEPLTEDQFCVVTQHHAVYDGYSLNLLLTAISNLYIGQADTSTVVPFQSFIQHTMNSDPEKARQFWGRQFFEAEATPFPATPSLPGQPRAERVVQRNLSNLQWRNQHATPSTST
jgi:amino acid adenylation domain-containing protein